MGLVRSLIALTLLACFLFIGATMPLGSRTLFGHLSNIWHSEEAQELVEGVKQSSGPVVERVKRGVQASLRDEPPADLSTDEDEDSAASED